MDDVRSTPRQLTDAEVARLHDLKQAGQDFIDKLKSLPSSREVSIAITNAEQSVMWAVKGITA